jgi:hypothetical protein
MKRRKPSGAFDSLANPSSMPDLSPNRDDDSNSSGAAMVGEADEDRGISDVIARRSPPRIAEKGSIHPSPRPSTEDPAPRFLLPICHRAIPQGDNSGRNQDMRFSPSEAATTKAIRFVDPFAFSP